jgi:hypothetical protein
MAKSTNILITKFYEEKQVVMYFFQMKAAVCRL